MNDGLQARVIFDGDAMLPAKCIDLCTTIFKCALAVRMILEAAHTLWTDSGCRVPNAASWSSSKMKQRKTVRHLTMVSIKFLVSQMQHETLNKPEDQSWPQTCVT